MFGGGNTYGNATSLGNSESAIADPDFVGMNLPGVPPSARWAPTGPLLFRM
jgi:hypothetical protein